MDDYNSFSTIDHLVEFGMGMAIAQQMVSTMNHCIGNMQIPGTGNTPNQRKPSVQYHILVNNAVAGPFSEDELATLAKAKSLTSDTMVWKPSMRGWMQAKNVPEVQKIILLNP
mgnify:CR=1 FL=1